MFSLGNFVFPDKQKELFKKELNEVFQRSSMSYVEVIDIGIGHRIASLRVDKKNKGRYYFRYGILIVYYYDNENETIASVVDIRCFKTNSNGVLEETPSFVKYWHSCLTKSIPHYFNKYSPDSRYRVILMYSRAPFIDEEHDIVRQDYSLVDSYTAIPIFPRPAPMLLEIDGVEVLIKQATYKTVVKRGVDDLTKMPITQESSYKLGFLAILKENYFKEKGKFRNLHQLLKHESFLSSI